MLIEEKQKRIAKSVKQNEVTNVAAISTAVNGLLLSKTAKKYFVDNKLSHVFVGDEILLPRNHVRLIAMVKDIGIKNAGEEWQLVPLKKHIKYVVLTDGDGAFERICEDHKVWGSRNGRTKDNAWIHASEERHGWRVNGQVVTIKI